MGDKIERLAIVLVGPTAAEQVGYTARLMASYGVEQGSLVAPSCDINSLEARSAASAQGAVRLATMQTFSRLRDAVKNSMFVISVDKPVPGKNEISLPEVVRLVSKFHLALVWFSDQGSDLSEGNGVITHNLNLPRSALGPGIPTSHSVGICLARIYADLTTVE